jgi:hypothetical protein
MECYCSCKNPHTVTIVLLAILLHSIVLIVLFVHQQYQDAHQKAHNAHVLPQGPGEQAQVLFQNAPEDNAAPSQGAPVAGPHVSAAPVMTAMQQAEVVEEAAAPSSADNGDRQEVVEDFEPPLSATQFYQDATSTAQSPVPVVQHNTSTGKRRKAGYSGRKKVSAQAAAALGSLAQGFAKSMQMERAQTPPVQATIDDMTRRRYTSKVYSMIQRSVNVRKQMLHLAGAVHTDAVLSITIDKKGVVHDVHLDHPNKTHDLSIVEQELCIAAKSAGLYPPVPASFNMDPFTLRFFIRIICHQGFHSYHLSYMDE